MDLSQNKQHQIIGNLKINWNHKTIFQTHNFICFPPKLLFVLCLCKDEGLCPDCTSINSSINRTLNKILPRLRACEQSEFSLAIISRWFIDAEPESDALMRLSWGEMRLRMQPALRYVLKRRQADWIVDQIKIIGPIKFLLEVFAQGDSYRVIISPVNGQIILIVVYIDCIQHPAIISRSWCTSGSIKQISFTNKCINGTISIAVLYFLYSHVLEQLFVITRAGPRATFGHIWCRTRSTECHSWLRVYNSIAN